MRPRHRSLSIPTHTRHYTVVGNPLIHQAVPLSRHRSRITVTLELCCALTGASRPEHTQGSARLYATETPMFEHPYAHPALHGGGKPAHSASGWRRRRSRSLLLLLLKHFFTLQLVLLQEGRAWPTA